MFNYHNTDKNLRLSLLIISVVWNHILGIDKDDEHKEEDEKGVSLLEVNIP